MGAGRNSEVVGAPSGLPQQPDVGTVPPCWERRNVQGAIRTQGGEVTSMEGRRGADRRWSGEVLRKQRTLEEGQLC